MLTDVIPGVDQTFVSPLTHLGSTVSLLAQRVLADGYDESVLKQLLGARTNVPQIIGHEQRGCHDGPQCHLRLLLVVTQPKVPNHELEKWTSVINM